jgi:hypothetical protein
LEVLPIDLTAIVAIIMGISIVLVPVIGLTARFALKPFVESMGTFLQSRNVEETVRILERRMALMEQQMEAMETSIGRVSDAAEFHRDLRGGGHAQLPAAPGAIGVPGGAPAGSALGGPVARPGDARP